MKFFDSNHRELCDLEFDGNYPDIFIAKATYLDDGTDVPEEELDAAADGLCLCQQCQEVT